MSSVATELLLAKLANAEHSAFGWDGYDDDAFAADRDAIETDMLMLVERGLLTLVDTESFDRTVYYTLTEMGRRTAEYTESKTLCEVQPDAAKRAAATLWLWLVIHGAHFGRYNETDSWGRHGEIAHLLVCGLNLDKSSAVRDDIWTEWGGTFGEDSRVGVVAGDATCNCGKVKAFTVTARVESITALMNQLLATTIRG